jgi:transposase InsO family protein
LNPGSTTSLAFGRRQHEAGLVASMGSVGDALDNAVAVNCFPILECELLDRYDRPTRQALRTALFDFIEVFHNRRRRHSTLDVRTPSTTRTSIPDQIPPHRQPVHNRRASPKSTVLA